MGTSLHLQLYMPYARGGDFFFFVLIYDTARFEKAALKLYNCPLNRLPVMNNEFVSLLGYLFHIIKIKEGTDSSTLPDKIILYSSH